MRKLGYCRIISLLLILLTVSGTVLAQNRMRMGAQRGMGAQQGANIPNGGPFNPVARLERALQTANAPALSTDQENQITDMIKSLTASRQNQPANTTLQAARQALENAILARDSAAAAAQAGIIATQMQNQTLQRVKDQANFAISVLNILSGTQLSALQTSIGSDGLVRLVMSLAGGPRLGRPGR